MDTINFLDRPFRPITLEYQQLLETHLKQYPQPLTGYTFASLFAWADVYQFYWHFLEPETLLISTQEKNNAARHLLQPVGAFSTESQKWLLTACTSQPYPLQLLGVSQTFIDQSLDFCSSFSIDPRRNNDNYLYRASDLALLKGHDYEKKRNLIAQAERAYNSIMSQPLTQQIMPLCREVLQRIAVDEPPLHLQNELQALDRVLKHFDQLKQSGVLLTIDEIPVAFSIYEQQKPNTTVIHFEKADRSYKGAYQLINRATAEQIDREGYEWINREEDMGIEGLRQAKLSYAPSSFELSYNLKWVGPSNPDEP